MTVQEFYNKIGSDYNDVVGRLMNDAFIIRLLNKYAQDRNYTNLVENVQKGNMEDAFLSIHTLKGMALNLGFDKLSEASIALTEYLRAGGTDIKKVEELLKPIGEEHNKIIQLIKIVE